MRDYASAAGYPAYFILDIHSRVSVQFVEAVQGIWREYFVGLAVNASEFQWCQPDREEAVGVRRPTQG